MAEQTKPQIKSTIKWIKEKFKSERPLTRDEESVLFSLAKAGNLAAKTKLLQSNMKFVIKVAANYSNNTLTQEELVNEGAIGLWHAIRYYDTSRGVRFITYAVWWIKAHITRAISEKGNIIRLPINQQLLLKRARKERSTGGEMSPEMKILDEMDGHYVSLNKPLSSEISYTLEDLIKDENAEPVDKNITQETQNKLVRKYLNKLPQKERQVIKDLNGIDRDFDRSVREESRVLRLSRERIRQLRDQAIQRIRNWNYDGHISAELFS